MSPRLRKIAFGNPGMIGVCATRCMDVGHDVEIRTPGAGAPYAEIWAEGPTAAVATQIAAEFAAEESAAGSDGPPYELQPPPQERRESRHEGGSGPLAYELTLIDYRADTSWDWTHPFTLTGQVVGYGGGGNYDGEDYLRRALPAAAAAAVTFDSELSQFFAYADDPAPLEAIVALLDYGTHCHETLQRGPGRQPGEWVEAAAHMLDVVDAPHEVIAAIERVGPRLSRDEVARLLTLVPVSFRPRIFALLKASGPRR